MFILRRVPSSWSSTGLRVRIHSLKGSLWLAGFRVFREALLSFGKAAVFMGNGAVYIFRVREAV